jgi:peptide/nickel transport system permease protein
VIQGFSGYFITMRNILPNVLPLVFAQAAIVFGWAVVDLAAISYLGLGVQPPTADWGQMIANGQASILRGYPEESVYAGALIVILVVCVTLLSDRLSERWEASHVAGD